jgi:hypothetical protein
MKRYILCYLVASGSGPENSCPPGPTSNTASLTPRCPGYSATLTGPPPDASRTRAASALGTCTLARAFGGTSTR